MIAAPAMEREVDALILCARRDLDAESAGRLADLAATGLDWEALVRLGRRHGLLPLLARHLPALGDAAPAPLLEALRGAGTAVARRNLGLLAELFRALDRLTGDGVAAVPLKGPVLAVALYGDLALREFTDLDVLVPAGRVLAARDALADLGYRPLDWLPPEAEAGVLRSGNALALEGDRDGLRERLVPATDVGGVVQDFTGALHPGVGLEPAAFPPDAEAQVGLDPEAAQEPHQDERAQQGSSASGACARASSAEEGLEQRLEIGPQLCPSRSGRSTARFAG